MSYNTVPGKGGFFELENGEEVFLTPDMIPEPPASTFTDNPHEAGTTRFRRWRIAAKARYSKAWYKAAVDAQNTADFLAKVGSAEAILQDSASWDSYKSCRGLEEYKRPVGRPRLHLLQKKQPKLKRSDKMRQLLKDYGIAIKSIGQDEFLVEYPDWEFLPNGRLRYKQEPPISVHKFLQDHNCIS